MSDLEQIVAAVAEIESDYGPIRRKLGQTDVTNSALCLTLQTVQNCFELLKEMSGIENF